MTALKQGSRESAATANASATSSSAKRWVTSGPGVAHVPATRLRPPLTHPVLDVGGGGRGDDLDRLQLRVADVLEQPLAATEHDRDDVEVELLEQAGGEVLLDRVGAAGDQDVLLAGRRAGLLERGVDPVGDEVERRA